MTTDIKHETKHNASHTAGPWYTGSPDYQVLYRDSEGFSREICDCIAPRISLTENAANARLIASSPKLLAFAATIARMTQDWEEVNGEEFVMESDDAISTLNALIDEARGLVAEAKGLAA